MATVHHRHPPQRSSDGDLGTTQSDDGGIGKTLTVPRPQLFSGIAVSDYDSICSAGRVRRFAAGEVLYLEESVVDKVILVNSGSVKITKLGRGGEEVIVRLAAQGDVLAVVGLMACGKHCTTAEVIRDCEALVWDARVFKDLVSRHALLQRNILAVLDEHLRDLEERFREVATERAGARVAFQLLRLLKSMGKPVEAGIEVGLSREELAQMTGTTLFTVSRLLSEWEARGVVKPRRKAVAICDAHSLCQIAQEDVPQREDPLP